MSEDRMRPDALSADAAPSGFGAQLAAARERAGLGVGDVAARLRLHTNQVRAIESETLAKLPEAAYVRGFVRSYARMLGLDPAPLLDDLNRKLAPDDASVVDGMATAKEYSPVRAAANEQASRWLVLGMAVAALIALGLIGWYATRAAEPAATLVPPGRAPAPAPAAAAPTVVAVPVTTSAVTEASTNPSAPTTAPAAEGPVAAAADPAGGAAAAPPSEATAAPPVLSLAFHGASWVEVTDSQGRVLVSQVANAGDVLQPAGAPPFAVVLGDAAQVTAMVRGAAFSLEPVTRSNVARFSVK
jgi:cytoskeleton protein RodZ